MQGPMKRGRDDSVRGLAGKYAELHPWHPSPVLFERVLYPSLEHAYVAATAGDGAQAADLRARLASAESVTASKARSMGSPDTLDTKRRLAAMRALLRDKMMRHPRCKQLLLETVDARIYHDDDTADEFWGVRSGVGSNHLGVLLESVRTEISAGKQVSTWVSSVCEPLPADSVPGVSVSVERKGVEIDKRALDGSRAFHTVGKFESSDFVLEHVSSSRKHALLAFDARSTSGLAVIDLGSKAGTWLDGARVAPLVPTDLPTGAELVFGQGSSRVFRVSVDVHRLISALEQRRAQLRSEVAQLERDVADEKSGFGLVASKRVDPSRRTCFVGNLPYEVEEGDVKELFGAYGAVSRVNLPLDRETNKPRGIAFVEFAHAADAHAACALSGEDFLGRTLKVELAQPSAPRPAPRSPR